MFFSTTIRVNIGRALLCVPLNHFSDYITMSGDLANKPPVFQLKASLYTLTTLHLLEADLEALDEQLIKLKHQAPKFFNSVPVIVDAQRLSMSALEQFDFAALKKILSQHQLIIVGLRHVPESAHVAAKNVGFALLPDATQTKSGARSAELPKAKPLATEEKNKTDAVAPKAAPATTQTEPAEPSSALMINRSVRSGQQIYAKGTDLIVIGSVSPGAEIIADGSIHVYGQLKGRALAGVSGDQHARIFCKQIAAELVSIAGHYWLYEDIIARAHGLQPLIQVFLQDNQLSLSQI
jgi:septum site-determining protein MinC